MEIKVENLTAEKGKDGCVYIYLSDSRLGEGRILVQKNSMVESVKWTPEDSDIIRRAWI